MYKLAIVGAKNSGKTTLIEALITQLRAGGYSVATIKHTSHHHRFDKEGKDSYRHRDAGAALTVAISGEETAVFAKPYTIDIGKLQEMTAEQFDIWLIEGNHLSGHPKVFLTRNLKDFTDKLPSNIIASFGDEKVNDSLPHFSETDSKGLGAFVITSILEKKPEIAE
jgi:molybdopterin-guanine dinucleotide biosynthesis protein B